MLDLLSRSSNAGYFVGDTYFCATDLFYERNLIASDIMGLVILRQLDAEVILKVGCRIVDGVVYCQIPLLILLSRSLRLDQGDVAFPIIEASL